MKQILLPTFVVKLNHFLPITTNVKLNNMLTVKLSYFFKTGNLLLYFLIFAISLTDPKSFPEDDKFMVNDKLLHIFAYFLLCLTTMLAQWEYKIIKNNFSFKSMKKSTNNYSITLFITLFYGLLIETIQRFIPNRNFELNDVIANFLGISFGLFAFYLIVSIQTYRNPKNI